MWSSCNVPAMPTIRRLTDSCLLITSEHGTTVIDPGFLTFESDEIELETIGDVQHVLVTHEHGDHVKPEFVRWLVDRGTDVTVHSNESVSALLARYDIEASNENPPGVSSQDVLHEMVPSGQRPPNRSFTIEGVITHPGDSYEPTTTAPVLALPLVAPWGSATAAVEFARRLAPRQVVPIHDFYMSRNGRRWIADAVKDVLAPAIELIVLDWGDSYSV